MMFTSARSVFYLRLSCALALVSLMAGCELAEETVFLDREAEFTFRFDGADISPEGQVQSVSSVDFEGRLDGFLKEDIVAANIISAEIERSAPPGANLDEIFSSVEFALDNGQRSVVAGQNSLPGSREAPLDVSTENITAQASAANGFTGHLEVEAAEEIDPDREYSVVVTLDVSLELEGI